MNCTRLVVLTYRSQGITILWITSNTERGTIELCNSGCVIPGMSVSDSLGTSICGSEVAKCEAVSTVSTVSGSELRLGARAVRCDASRLVHAVRVKWDAKFTWNKWRKLGQCMRDLQLPWWWLEVTVSAQWRHLARHTFTDDPPQRRKYLPDYTAPVPGMMVIYFHVCLWFIFRFVLITLAAVNCIRINAPVWTVVWTVIARRHLLDDVTSLVQCSTALSVRLEGAMVRADMKSWWQNDSVSWPLEVKVVWQSAAA